MLLINHISVDFDAIPILRGVSLEFSHGAVCGLVDRNGAGKTTTLRAIMRLVDHKDGNAGLDNVKISNTAGHTRASKGNAYLPEDRRLTGTLTVEENLVLPLETSGESAGIIQENLAMVYELLPEVEVFRSRRAPALSGGQQKFTALARGFIIGHRFLLPDEPFEGVSMALSKWRAKAVATFQVRCEGCSILVAESDMNSFAMLARQAFEIERGKIISTLGIQKKHTRVSKSKTTLKNRQS